MSPMAAPRSADPAPVMDRDAWEMHPAGRTGLEFYDLSHTFGPNAPLWPYFDDVEIKRIHYHAKSGVLSQRISTVMHCTTHLDAPAHVVEGTPYTDEVPLEQFFGTGVAVSIPKKQWEVITPEDLEAARPEIRPGDFVVINTGWPPRSAGTPRRRARRWRRGRWTSTGSSPAATPATTSRSGSRATASSSATALSASRTSAATWTRSPAAAAPSRP